MLASVALGEKPRSPWIANEEQRRLDHHILGVSPQFLGGVGRKASRREMKILFLHGWNSVPGGVKPTYLKSHGHTVINPTLDDEDFEEAVRVAQAEFDQHQPDVVGRKVLRKILLRPSLALTLPSNYRPPFSGAA